MLMEIPERFLRSNALFDLFEVDGKAVQAKLLTANVAETWAVGARKVDDLDQRLEYMSGRLDAAVKSRATAPEDERELAELNVDKVIEVVRTIQLERHQQIIGCLRAYGPPFDDGVFTSATSAQLVWAFHLLKRYNDPFVVMGSLQLEALRQMTGRLNTETKS